MAAIYNFDTITFRPHNIGKPTKSTNSTVKCLELQKPTLELSFFRVYNQESSNIQSIVIQCTMGKCISGGRPIICTNWQLFYYLENLLLSISPSKHNQFKIHKNCHDIPKLA